MKRRLFTILSVCSVVLVLGQMGGLLYLYYLGLLTSENLREVQSILDGTNPLAADQNALIEEAPEVSIEEVMRARIVRTFDLEDRERETDRLALLIVERRNSILQEKLALEGQKAQFEEQWQDLKDQETSEATQLAQGVLLALPPTEAVRDLMQLNLNQNVLLLKGMPVKSIGKILKEFNQGDDDQRKRGAEIFESLARGDPAVPLLQDHLERLQ